MTRIRLLSHAAWALLVVAALALVTQWLAPGWLWPSAKNVFFVALIASATCSALAGELRNRRQNRNFNSRKETS